MDARRKQSDLSSIQAQFDAKYRQHLSALDDAFASNIQWIESTVDDGLRQIGAERCRNKRKHPEVPKFPENKENTIGAKKPEATLSRRQTRTRTSTLKDTQLNECNSPVTETILHEEISLLPEGVEADVESTEPMTVDSGEGCPLEDSKLISDEPVENLVEQAVEPVASPSVEPVASPVSSVFVPTAISGVNDGILPEDLNKLKVIELRAELKARGVETKGLKKALVKRLEDLVDEDMLAEASSRSLLQDAAEKEPSPLLPKKRTSEELETDPETNDMECSHRRKRSSVAQVADETCTQEEARVVESPENTEGKQLVSEESDFESAVEQSSTLFPGGGLPPSIQEELAALKALADQEELDSGTQQMNDVSTDAPDHGAHKQDDDTVDSPARDAQATQPDGSPVAGVTFIPAVVDADPSPASIAKDLAEAPAEEEEDVVPEAASESPKLETVFPGGGVPADVAAELDALKELADHHLAAEEEEERNSASNDLAAPVIDALKSAEFVVSVPSPVAQTATNDDLRRKIQMLNEAQTSSKPLAAQTSAGEPRASECAPGLSPAHSEDDSMTELESQLSKEDILVVDTATTWVCRPAQETAPKVASKEVAPASKHAAAAERRKALEQSKKEERAAREQKREAANARRKQMQQQVVEDTNRGEILAADRARKEKMAAERARKEKMEAKMLAAKNAVAAAAAKKKEEDAAKRKEEAAKEAEATRKEAEAAKQAERELAAQAASPITLHIPANLVSQTNASQANPFKAPPAGFKPQQPSSQDDARKLSLEDADSNYSISPQRDSDDSESDSEDEPTKKIPKWASREEISKAIDRQRTQDPDAIFPLVNTCDLGRIFTSGRERKCFTKRGESGMWEKDGLQMSEIQRWRKQMGFSMNK